MVRAGIFHSVSPIEETRLCSKYRSNFFSKHCQMRESFFARLPMPLRQIPHVWMRFPSSGFPIWSLQGRFAVRFAPTGIVYSQSNGSTRGPCPEGVSGSDGSRGTENSICLAKTNKQRGRPYPIFNQPPFINRGWGGPSKSDDTPPTQGHPTMN